MEIRKLKKTLYIVFYLILFFFVIGTIASFFVPSPTCTDGKQNQNEEGVDCGGPCATLCPEKPLEEVQDIVIEEEAQVLSTSSGRWDAVVSVMNPNQLYGSGDLTYTFTFFDSQGNAVKTVRDTSYILPFQNRYFMALEVEMKGEPERVEFAIEAISWEKFREYEAPVLRVSNKQFSILSSSPDYAQAVGLVINKSPYDFETVDAQVVARDASGEIIAVGYTDMQTVISGDRREFIVVWPYFFEGEVAQIEAHAITNMFENQNFIKLYFPGGRFQSYE